MKKIVSRALLVRCAFLLTHSGNLYTDFTSSFDYVQVRDYAKSLGVLQWENESKRMLFVTAEGHESVREFIQRRRV